MKSIIVTSIAASSLFAALALAQPRAQPPSYAVTDLGVVGIGQPYFITNNGIVSGGASNPDGTDHAVLWYKGLKTDLGTPGLGGLNSVAFGANDRAKPWAKLRLQLRIRIAKTFAASMLLGFRPSITPVPLSFGKTA